MMVYCAYCDYYGDVAGFYGIDDEGAFYLACADCWSEYYRVFNRLHGADKEYESLRAGARKFREFLRNGPYE